MRNSTQKLLDAQNEALVIMRNLIKLHNGNFVFSTLENAYDEESNDLNEDFYKSALKFTADTQYDTNETVYLLSIYDNGTSYPMCKCVTEGGEEVTVNLLEADAFTVCEIADWINGLKIIG